MKNYKNSLINLVSITIKKDVFTMDYYQLADLLFPNINTTRETLEALYPPRNISKGACVTRIGPSPTGFVHLGNLYNAIIGERLAHQSDGIFYLRIEDTDNKREVEGAVDTVINAMDYFDVKFDEGALPIGDNGSYGPYRQRQRVAIYQTFAKWLTQQGKVYPCFLSEEELLSIREKQINEKLQIGIYGEFAKKSRNLSYDEIYEKVSRGEKWVLRYKGEINSDFICVEDAIRGKLEMPRNYIDFVVLKSDGVPTYHFAHVIDDHLMRTTHVIRGEEWIPSLPIHVELFNSLGWELPTYCHTATLMKVDGNSKRKLSKRKDPELALSFYQKEGISQDAMWEYLLTVLNSNFEEWRNEHPLMNYKSFPFSLEKMSNSGCLVDLQKLRDISKNVISRMTASEVYDRWYIWCLEYNKDYAKLIHENKERTLCALSIGRGIEKPRRDIENWKQACDFMSFYYEELFTIVDDMTEQADNDTIKKFFNMYLNGYNFDDDSSKWFEKVKKITNDLGFAVKPKDYKKSPELFKGSIVQITNMLRIALTGRANAPDIWEVSQVLGSEIVKNRLKRWCS